MTPAEHAMQQRAMGLQMIARGTIQSYGIDHALMLALTLLDTIAGATVQGGNVESEKMQRAAREGARAATDVLRQMVQVPTGVIIP